MAGPVLLGASYDQLLRPVHVLGGESVAPAGQLGTDVQTRAVRLVGRGVRTLGVARVEARPVLVAAGDARLWGDGVRSKVTRGQVRGHTRVGAEVMARQGVASATACCGRPTAHSVGLPAVQCGKVGSLSGSFTVVGVVADYKWL